MHTYIQQNYLVKNHTIKLTDNNLYTQQILLYHKVQDDDLDTSFQQALQHGLVVDLVHLLADYQYIVQI